VGESSSTLATDPNLVASRRGGKEDVMIKRVCTVLSLFLPFLILGSTYAGEVIRNGSFDDFLWQWNLNARLTATGTWPLVGGKVSLHPPSWSFMGTVIYQNLNVTDIAGKEAQISCKLTKYYAPE